MSNLHKLLFYAGLEPEEYQECLPEIRKDNRKKLRVYLGIAIGFLFAIICLSGGVHVLRSNSVFYWVAFVVCLALLGIEMAFPEHNAMLLNWLMYAIAALLYALGICIMLSSPDELSVSFIAFLMAVPLLFVMPPIQHICNIIFFDVIFIVLAATLETGRVAAIDIIDSVVFGLVSCIISSFMMVSMYQNFLSRTKLRKYANYDIMTNMQNRNAYESNREHWSQRCSVSLSCVYVDVNGLHEMNNTCGHEQGDQMLQTVALEMREIFGKNNCYRTGGDEFVAFVLDAQHPAVREKAEQLSRSLERKGYSVAVGVAHQSAGGIDMDALIKQAEKRMYTAKEEHYRSRQQPLR